MPVLELPRRVGAEQERQRGPGVARHEGPQGVDGVRRPRALELQPLHREPRRALHRELQHGGPVGGRRGVLPQLERLLPGRHEPQLIQAERLGGSLADDQVTMVNGIERAPEEADLHEAPGPAGQALAAPGTSEWKRRMYPQVSATSSL